MTIIVFSKNIVRILMGVMRRYSILEVLPTVVTEIIIEPTNEKSSTALKMAAPIPRFSEIKDSIKSQNIGAIASTPHRITPPTITGIENFKTRFRRPLFSVLLPFAFLSLKDRVRSSRRRKSRSDELKPIHPSTAQLVAYRDLLLERERFLPRNSDLWLSS